MFDNYILPFAVSESSLRGHHLDYFTTLIQSHLLDEPSLNQLSIEARLELLTPILQGN